MRSENIYTYELKPGEQWKWLKSPGRWVVVKTQHTHAMERLEQIRGAFEQWQMDPMSGAFEEVERLIYEPLG